MAQATAAAAQQQEPQRAPDDGKLRIYLYVNEGDLEQKLAMKYLDRYKDDPPDSKVKRIRKVSELRLDRARENWVIIAVVRDINRDYSERIEVNGRFQPKDHHGDVHECTPIEVADFCRDAPSGDVEGDGSFDENGLVNALAKVCTPAAPRIQRRGDGRGNHARWLTLRWG